MAITLKHGVNPAVALTASFGSGQAAKRQELEKEQRTVQTAQRARDVQRAFQASQAEKSRIFSREQGESARALQLEDREAARALQLEDRETMREQGFEDEERKYSARQRQEYNSRWAAIEEAKQSGEFTPEEVVEMERQAMMQDAGMTVEKRLEEPKMTIQEQIESETWVDPATGQRYGRDANGAIKKIGDAANAEKAEDEGVDDKTIDSLLEEAKHELMVESGGNALPTQADKLKRAEQIYKDRMALKARLSGEAVADTETDPESTVADIEKKVGLAPSSGVSDFFKKLVGQVGDAAALPLTLPVEAAKKGVDYVKDAWKKPEEKTPSENPDQEAEDWLKNNPDHPKADDVRKKLQKRRRTA